MPDFRIFDAGMKRFSFQQRQSFSPKVPVSFNCISVLLSICHCFRVSYEVDLRSLRS